MDKDKRKAELLAALKDIDEARATILRPVVEEVIFLEWQMEELRKLPFIKTHPDNPALQKQTEAARQYTKLNAAYLQGVKVLCSGLNKSVLEDDDSPINRWLKKAVGDD